MKLIENFSLKGLNTFRIDVKADFFLPINKKEELPEAFSIAQEKKLSPLIIGEGSNILFTKDFEGLVIKPSIKGIKKVQENEKNVLLKVGAGENWHNLVLKTLSLGLQGLENLSLIPGSVGAAPVQNIGAYGVEIKDFIDKVEIFDIERNDFYFLKNENCDFSYRNSVFKASLKGKVVITHIYLKLRKNPVFNISYQPLSEALRNKKISAKEISNAVIKIRQSKLPDPTLVGNAGSFFKNPIINKSEFEALKAKYPDLNGYKIQDDKIKISAGWLIEKAGLKGYSKGDVGTYEKQALVIVNNGNASGKEVLAFSETIQENVCNKFGVRLAPEVNII